MTCSVPSSSWVLTTSPDKLTKWPYTTAGGGWIKVTIYYRYNGGVYRVYTDAAVISFIYHHYYSWHPLATLITYHVSANTSWYADGSQCYSIMAYMGEGFISRHDMLACQLWRAALINHSQARFKVLNVMGAMLPPIPPSSCYSRQHDTSHHAQADDNL